MDTINNPFSIFSQFWKNANPFVPPLNEEEIDRKILECRTVEQWLTMQVGMLQMSIQALELQKAGLRAFKQGTDSSTKTEDSPAT